MEKLLSQIPKAWLTEAISNKNSGKRKAVVNILTRLAEEDELTVNKYLDGLRIDVNQRLFNQKIA